MSSVDLTAGLQHNKSPWYALPVVRRLHGIEGGVIRLELPNGRTVRRPGGSGSLTAAAALEPAGVADSKPVPQRDLDEWLNNVGAGSTAPCRGEGAEPLRMQQARNPRP